MKLLLDLCVPDSALRWGTLTGIDHEPSWSFGPDGRGHVYAAGQTYPVLAAKPLPIRGRVEEFDAAPRALIRHMAPPSDPWRK